MAHNELASVNRKLSHYKQHLQFLTALDSDPNLKGQALDQMRSTVNEIIYNLEDKKRWLESELP